MTRELMDTEDETMPTAHRARRRSSVLVVLAALLAVLFVPVPPAAHADSGMESSFVSEINRERAAAGLGSLSTAGDLISVARRHSGVMAAQNNLHHNPNLASDVSGWQKVGENVGRGPSVATLHQAFMDSPGHRKNVLDGDWTEVGVGVVVDNGTVWVTVVFRKPQGAAASTSEPKPEPEPAPAADSSASSGSSSGSSSESSSESSGGSSSGQSSAPEPEPEPEPEPVEPEPHEVIDQPLPLDRVTLFLAREEAAERLLRLEDVLADS